MKSWISAVDLVRLRGRRHWRAADGRRVLAALGRSGLSVSAFSRENGLGRTRVHWWKQREASSRPRKKEEARIRLVPVVPIALSPPAPAVLIRLPNGIAIEVESTAAVGPEWASRLVSGLAERA